MAAARAGRRPGVTGGRLGRRRGPRRAHSRKRPPAPSRRPAPRPRSAGCQRGSLRTANLRVVVLVERHARLALAQAVHVLAVCVDRGREERDDVPAGVVLDLLHVERDLLALSGVGGGEALVEELLVGRVVEVRLVRRREFLSRPKATIGK